MAIIPVVLKFSGVAQNYNLCLTLTTPDVAWSLGEGGEDDLGISYNALSLDDKRISGIQRIEFTGSTLKINTGHGVGGDFSLTAFIDAPDNTRWLQGYCVLNEKAHVFARLGDIDPVEWRDEINCVIPVLLPDIHRTTFTVRGARQGQLIRLHLAADGAAVAHDGVRWCVAPLENPEIGLTIRSTREDVALPIAMFYVDGANIDLTIGTTQKGAMTSVDFNVEAYIERIRQCRYCPPPASVRLKVECDESVAVFARVGNQRPQYLAQVYKLFAL
jgi:hypothetical protein